MLQFNIVSWRGLAPGLSHLSDWQLWADQTKNIDISLTMPATPAVPMLLARRLKGGSRLAADIAISLLSQYDNIDAIVFASRHGELERNFNILKALAHQQDISPTDFTMSVHNATVGSVAIASKFKRLTTSIAAGMDTFQQALNEVSVLLQTGANRVLFVDFDNAIPAFYQPLIQQNTTYFPWAVALVLEKGMDLSCQTEEKKSNEQQTLPQALIFLQHWINKSRDFIIQGERFQWHWSLSA